MAEVAASAATGPMIESAWHNPVVPGVHGLWSHLLLLLILCLEVSDHFLYDSDGLIVTHPGLITVLHLALGYYCKDLVTLTCKKRVRVNAS